MFQCARDFGDAAFHSLCSRIPRSLPKPSHKLSEAGPRLILICAVVTGARPLDLCAVIERFQAKAATRTTVRSAVLLLTSSTAVRTPAGFSGRLPCFGNSITSSASPAMKFTALSVWLLAIPNIGLSKNSSICQRMRATRHLLVREQ